MINMINRIYNYINDDNNSNIIDYLHENIYFRLRFGLVISINTYFWLNSCCVRAKFNIKCLLVELAIQYLNYLSEIFESSVKTVFF